MKSIPEQKFYDLLSLKLSGDASIEQLVLLEEQLLINPQWQFMYDQVMQNPQLFSNPEDHALQAYATHFVKMQLQGKLTGDAGIGRKGEELVADHQTYPLRSLRRWVYPLLIAASLIGVFLCILYLFPDKPVIKIPAAPSEVVTRKGSKSNIKLPDGTMVWLNADSKLTYGEQFIGKTREITLSGEAYFDVAHDTSRPFIIHTGNARIRVIGTAFNVRNYPQDKTWETTLMRGKIEVSVDDRPDEIIILKPLEKLIIAKDYPNLAGGMPLPSDQPANKVVLTAVNYSRKDSLVAETSWINDKLVFINEPLYKIGSELERQFAITVLFKTMEVRNYRYTGDFEKESLEKILQILSMSKKINYSFTDSTVIIE